MDKYEQHTKGPLYPSNQSSYPPNRSPQPPNRSPQLPNRSPQSPTQSPHPPNQSFYSPSQAQYPPPYSSNQQPSHPLDWQTYPPSQQPYPPLQQPYPPHQHDYRSPVNPVYNPPQPYYSQPQPGRPNTQPNHPPNQRPITNQPVAQEDSEWMQRPQALPNTPPGLEYLSMVDELLVYQQIDLLEIMTNYEVENRYSIHNAMGQLVYFATEESDTCMRLCWGASRPYEMKITDNFGQEVIHLSRPFKCQCCCCFCCLQTMEVSSPPGVLIGTIEQNWNPISTSFSLKDPFGDEILQIKGPCCTVSCSCSDIEFEVFIANDSSPIGKITKKWSGYLREAYTNADNFGITFPKDLNVKMKAVLLGALFLIDMMYFEQKPKR